MPHDQLTLGATTVELIQGDITLIPVDAMVNAANSALAGGGGVDGAIHRAAGPSLLQELRRYNGCPTGDVVVTGAGRLPARYVFHAVGPVYRDGTFGEPALLASCYQRSLELAQQYNCLSISFPSISTGVYGYPPEAAADVVLVTLARILPSFTSISVVKLVQFNRAGLNIYRQRMSALPLSSIAAQTG